MLDVSREQLVLACEGAAAQWGAGSPLRLRTLELYENQTVYCFEEPANSMQKALREKMYLHGCRVVDCGTLGQMECLAVFLWDYDYIEAVNTLGNITGHVLHRPPPSPWAGSSRAGTAPARRASPAAALPTVPEPDGVSRIWRSCLGPAPPPPPPLDDETWVTFARGYCLALLYLPSKALKWSWLRGIRNASQTYGTIPPPAALLHSPCLPSPVAGEGDGEVGEAMRAAARSRLQRSPLFASLAEPENQACADCGSPQPTWCVLQPFGVFTCIDCIGVHRQLWANKCREVELDHWPEEDLAFMARRGNAVANAELEFGLRRDRLTADAVAKPSRSSPIADRELFIYQKYAERAFCKENIEETPAMLAEEMAAEEHPSSMAGRSAASMPASATSASASFFPFPVPFWDAGGPPRYSGVALVMVQQLSGFVRPPEPLFGRRGWICVLSNGYQEVRTQAGTRPRAAAAASVTAGPAPVLASWNETVQLGVEQVSQPLCVSIFSTDSKRRLLAAGELRLASDMIHTDGESGAEDGAMVPLTVRLCWSHLNYRHQYRPPDVWVLSLLASYIAYAEIVVHTTLMTTQTNGRDTLVTPTSPTACTPTVCLRLSFYASPLARRAPPSHLSVSHYPAAPFATMILTYTTLPFFVVIFSVMFYQIMKKMDPVNLEDYKDEVYGLHPMAVCLVTCLYPILVLIMYDFVLKCGVKPSKVGVKAKPGGLLALCGTAATPPRCKDASKEDKNVILLDLFSNSTSNSNSHPKSSEALLWMAPRPTPRKASRKRAFTTRPVCGYNGRFALPGLQAVPRSTSTPPPENLPLASRRMVDSIIYFNKLFKVPLGDISVTNDGGPTRTPSFPLLLQRCSHTSAMEFDGDLLRCVEQLVDDLSIHQTRTIDEDFTVRPKVGRDVEREKAETLAEAEMNFGPKPATSSFLAAQLLACYRDEVSATVMNSDNKREYLSVSAMPYLQCRVFKKKMKKRIYEWEAAVRAETGEQDVKPERKIPLRMLYELYHASKTRINNEQESMTASTNSTAVRGSDGRGSQRESHRSTPASAPSTGSSEPAAAAAAAAPPPAVAPPASSDALPEPAVAEDDPRIDRIVDRLPRIRIGTAAPETMSTPDLHAEKHFIKQHLHLFESEVENVLGSRPPNGAHRTRLTELYLRYGKLKQEMQRRDPSRGAPPYAADADTPATGGAGGRSRD
eukprot:gene5620-4039_t